ncbi:DnaB-like helicase C-terminal domain-containing protein [Streptomyces sp. NPDC006668]|uniref:DnaB-like helicase C-terminal domain-containing protein n=1 Tax=Streptomyces sp. NPDC006668 TaxID=3156903 RepID=UPI0033E80CD4
MERTVVHYLCAVCLKPLPLDSTDKITITGVTRDDSEQWLWGPYPVHAAPCRDRIAHPHAQELLDRPGHVMTSVERDADDPATRTLLAHWQELSSSRRADRTSIKYWSDQLSGPAQPPAEMPWPDMDGVARLSPGHLVCLGTRSRSREAQAGYDIAVHNAARGLCVAMFAPDLTARNAVPGLSVYRDTPLTSERIGARLNAMAVSGKHAQLVIVDRLQLMTAREDDDSRVRSLEQVDDVARDLKLIAKTDLLGYPPVLLLARLERPRCDGRPLHIDDLGAAAELVYHADVLALIDRTQPFEVDVFVEKDRSGPAPRHLTVSW